MRSTEQRVLVVDDHDLFADAVALTLRIEGFDVSRLNLSESGDPLAAALRERPRVALVDLDLGSYGDGTDLIEPLTLSGIDVVVVTASRDQAEWGGCLQRGARAVLCKSGALDDLVDVVRRLFQGLPAHDARGSRAADRLLAAGAPAVRRHARAVHAPDPTRRQVLRDLLEGSPFTRSRKSTWCRRRPCAPR